MNEPATNNTAVAVAWHESGHCVTAMATGVPVYLVEAGDRAAGGRVLYGSTGVNPVNEAAVSMAGAMAAAMAGHPETAFASAADVASIAGAAGRAGGDPAAFVRRATTLARETLQEHWSTVRRMVIELLRAGSIEMDFDPQHKTFAVVVRPGHRPARRTFLVVTRPGVRADR